jgi:hypothetical protein
MERADRRQLLVVLGIVVGLVAIMGFVVLRPRAEAKMPVASTGSGPDSTGWQILTPSIWPKEYSPFVMLEGRSVAQRLELVVDGRVAEKQDRSPGTNQWRFLVDSKKYGGKLVKIRERHFNGKTREHEMGVIPARK